MKPAVKKAAQKVKKAAKPLSAAPLPTDPSYKFYVSLFRQNPRSDMAIRWLCKNGLGHIVMDISSIKFNNQKSI